MAYIFQPAYPSRQHARAAERVTRFFRERPGVSAVLLTCSCARGKAVIDSCLDIAVLLDPQAGAIERTGLAAAWEAEYAAGVEYAELRAAGLYSHIDLEFHDGCFHQEEHGWTSGADEFELGIGNLLVYSAPLWQTGSYLSDLKAIWLPYYADGLREGRLAMVRKYCSNNLNHIPPYVERGLYFQAFTRLTHAFGEFLQAVFIARRTYPIAYDKWVREQVVDILDLPDLYPQLPRLFEIHHFESDEIRQKAACLSKLLDEYVPG